MTEDIRFLTDRALWETENLMKPGDPLYQNPEFHTKDLADLNVITQEESLTRQQLENYFYGIRDKIQAYLTDLKDEQLGEKPEVQIRNYLY